MKTIPTDPFALQARVMDALIDDILDPNAAASVQQTAGGNHGE
jgi:hypothetical protein